MDDDTPSGKSNNEIGEGQLPSQKPVRKIKLLIVAVEAADTTKEAVLECIIDCTKLKSLDSTSRMATSRPSIEKILETSAVLVIVDDGGVVGGIFSLWMMRLPAWLLTKFGRRRRGKESATPVVDKYVGGGEGETNDGDNDKRRDGIIVGVATTTAVFSKTLPLRGDDGQELLGFVDFFLLRVDRYNFCLSALLTL